MAKSNPDQERNETSFSTAVMTGGSNRRAQLYFQLIQSIPKAEQIDIIVSFLMESGVRMLLQHLKGALRSGAKIRILTGNYLGITQPSALYLLRHELGEKAELHFYQEKDRSFHPKSYIFHYATHSEIYIGSSNISRSALTSGIEWNYRFSSLTDPENYQKFYATFEDLFQNHSYVLDDAALKAYSKSWHKPAASRDLERYDYGGVDLVSDTGTDTDTDIDPAGSISPPLPFLPRGFQVEALCALENTRLEGASRALVVAATGTGKTALAAFDSKGFDKVLFVAHREEILRQAEKTFWKVRGKGSTGFFTGSEKDTKAEITLASVATLGNARYLNPQVFPPDHFSYLIIDEVHHGVAEQYKRIVEYFQPSFLLGLTATPERMDGKSIYELCDYNVPYEIPLREAINKGLLCPFHYYGIYDDTDYTGIHVVRGRYDEEELTEAYLKNPNRTDLIVRHYQKYGSRKALGFCCSRAHAQAMAAAFCERGIPSAAVVSGDGGDYSLDREVAIASLEKGILQVLFSVDMFNEGVDIPSVDMVLFLRPTQSPVVFLQQLGRGLRPSKEKEYLTVLDFIGNYEKAGRVRTTLIGEAPGEEGSPSSSTPGFLYARENNPDQNTLIPDGCLIDFDLHLIDLFQEMDKKQATVRTRIQGEYFRIKEMLGRRPSRMDLFTHMGEEEYRLALTHSKENPFKNYLAFLKGLGEQTPEEDDYLQGAAGAFLNLLETTNMTKVYKMPVLLSFLREGKVQIEVSDQEVLESWKAFFRRGTNWKDLEKNLTYEGFLRIPDKQHLSKIKTMPVHFLLRSGKGFFTEKEGAVLALREDLAPYVSQKAFASHYEDIVRYRAMDYYQKKYWKTR